MKLDNISIISGTLELVTGLHIGSGDAGMKIGGIDSPVIKHPISDLPYIPGSSLKGKMRSLLEWQAGVVQASQGKPLTSKAWKSLSGEQEKQGLNILQLFGASGDSNLTEEDALRIGPTRLSFWDCSLQPAWVESVHNRNLPLTEEKSENSIDRIRGVADNPRFIERVPAGALFDFKLTIKKLSEDDEQLLSIILRGLKLLELDGIGGSGSRGYGKIKLNALTLNEKDISNEFAAIQATI